VGLEASHASRALGAGPEAAGDALASNATGSVRGAIEDVDGGENLRVLFGLRCAVGELAQVPRVIEPSAMRLSATLTEALSLGATLGAP